LETVSSLEEEGGEGGEGGEGDGASPRGARARARGAAAARPCVTRQ